ncbi:MAG TPA: ACT domain-containing protein [Candidatus Latescibacteria bacterium]|nr:ACT domain-containing protein [Candidatus Latescibacterota bacterium]
MTAKQLSIFLENRSGRLHEVTDVLGRAGINIRALSLADTSDFGILRLIVDKPDEAYRILRNSGFTVRESDVLAVEVSDQPGGLAKVLEIFRNGGINVEYMYAFVEKSGKNAIVIFRTEDISRSSNLLSEHGVSQIEGEKLYKM